MKSSSTCFVYVTLSLLICPFIAWKKGRDCSADLARNLPQAANFSFRILYLWLNLGLSCLSSLVLCKYWLLFMYCHYIVPTFDKSLLHSLKQMASSTNSKIHCRCKMLFRCRLSWLFVPNEPICKHQEMTSTCILAMIISSTWFSAMDYYASGMLCLDLWSSNASPSSYHLFSLKLD